MGLPTVAFLALLVCLYVWARDREKRATEARTLRRFEHSDSTSLSSMTWDVDLLSMRMTQTFSSAGTPDVTREFHVRRVDAQTWQCKETDASFAAERARLEADVARAKTAALTDIARDELHDHDTSHEWSTLNDDDISGPLEVQYQRFLVHYRE